mgnify:CR=1 FL=1
MRNGLMRCIPRLGFKHSEILVYGILLRGTALYDLSGTRRIMCRYLCSFRCHWISCPCNTLWFVFSIYIWLECTWRKSRFVKSWHHLLNFWDIGRLDHSLGYCLDWVHGARDVVGKFTRSGGESFSSRNVILRGPITWIIKLKELIIQMCTTESASY